MKKKKFILIVLAVLLLLILPGFYNALIVRHYIIEAPEIASCIRIALITDLHSCAYGEGQRELVDAIDAEAPDLVLLGGDIFDDNLPDDNTEAFLRAISSQFPAYYVTGNHEYWSGETSFTHKMATLRENGIVRLSGEMVEVEVSGVRIAICGVDDPYAWADSFGFIERTEGSFRDQVEQVGAQVKNDMYTILLTHRPELLNVYSRYPFYLVLAGHAHGGQWRIPGIMNGLFAPNQGLFPKYAGGRYEQNNTVMIVSRGLARESTRAPRWYNPPELVIIDLIPVKSE